MFCPKGIAINQTLENIQSVVNATERDHIIELRVKAGLIDNFDNDDNNPILRRCWFFGYSFKHRTYNN